MVAVEAAIVELRNPWQAQELSEFSYFCCPECNYRSRLEEHFEHHAVNRHPSSIAFFSAEFKSENDIDVTSSVVYVKAEDNTSKDAIETENHLNSGTVSLESVIDSQSNQVTFVDKKTTPTEAIHDSFQCVTFNDDETQAWKVSDESRTQIADEFKDGDGHECQKCDMVIMGLAEFAIHVNGHDGKNKALKCLSCPASFSAKSKLKRHIEGVHLKLKETCDICGAVMSLNKLKSHFEIVHQSDRVNKPFKCNDCDFASHAVKYLKAHIFNCHKKDKHANECDICGKKFPFPSLLQEHKEDHEGIERFMCEKCGKRFAKKSLYTSHLRKGSCGVHSFSDLLPGRVKCEECDETFSDNRYYMIHFKATHGGYPSSFTPTVLCDQCPNAYETQQQLKVHKLRAHSGKYVYKSKCAPRKCAHCEKTFSTLTSLKEHIMSKHEKNTPFKCDQCHRSYGTRIRLKSHQNLVHRRVKCDDCNQDICNSFILKRHKAVVHNKKPESAYNCSYCVLFFSRKVFLDKHVQKHHSEKD